MNGDDAEGRNARTARGRKYFDTLWNPGPAEDMRNRLKHFCPDHCESTDVYIHRLLNSVLMLNQTCSMCGPYTSCGSAKMRF